MKTFLTNNIKFLFLFLGVLILGLLLPNNNIPRSIDYSLLEKHKMLDTIQNSKIILTGGSNVLFGFNSEIISDSMKMPVVNHAIHAGYGLKYILDDVSQFIKKGDIVILAPEYSHFLDNNRLGNEPLLFSLTAKPSNIKLISINQLIHVAPNVPKFSFDRMKSFLYSFLVNNNNNNKTISNVYGEFAINSHGDNKIHWNMEKQNFKPYKFSGTFNEQSLELILEFENAINNLGGTFYLTYPSLCQSGYLINKDCIKKISKQLNSSNIKIIGQPSNFVFKDDYFFDTPYHLNGKGVIKRTNLLIELTKN